MSGAPWPRLVRVVRRMVGRGPGAVDREMIARPHPGHRRGGGTLRCDCRPPGSSERGRQRRRHHLRGGVDTPPGRIGPRARGHRTAVTFPLRPTMSEPGTDRATLFLSRDWKSARHRAFVRHPGPGGRGVTHQPGHGPRPLCSRSARARRCVRSHRRRSGGATVRGRPPLTLSGRAASRRRPPSSSTSPTPPCSPCSTSTRPGRLVHTIMPTDPAGAARQLRPLRFTGSPGSDDARLHRAARADQSRSRRHTGTTGSASPGTFSCSPTGSARPDVSPPTPMVAWLTARFPDKEVVVVEDATAAVWRGPRPAGHRRRLHAHRPLAAGGPCPGDRRPGARADHRP